MRGKAAKKRVIAPDAQYGSVLLAKFINHVMMDGKKSIAQRVVYEALKEIEDTTKKDALKIFEEAIKNVMPQVEVKSRRVGGANYQVPMPVRGDRQLALSFRWVIDAARAKKGKPIAQKLATVIAEAGQNLGDAIKKRDDMHRMAEANKAFAHFARFSK
jgi:small subunit ribosomal protein S7